MSLGLKRVLVAEDAFLVAMDLAAQLQDMGAEEVCCAHRLESGIRLLKDNPNFDLAILDVNLADDLVFPLADQLYATGVPVIFVTAQQRTDFPEPWRRRAAIVQKPISDPQLLSAVQEAISPAIAANSP